MLRSLALGVALLLALSMPPLSATEYTVRDTLRPSCPDSPSVPFVVCDLAYDPALEVFHINGSGAPQIGLLDPVSMELTRCTDIGVYTPRLVLDKPGRRLYALCRDPDQILEIDADTHAILDTLPSGPDPEELAINIVTKKIYVSNMYQHIVTVVDAVGDSIIKTIQPGMYPGVPSVSKRHNRIYVPIWNGSLAVIDGTRDIVEEVLYLFGGICESELSWYNEARDELFVSTFNCPLLTVLDGGTLEILAENIWLPGYPSEIQGDPLSGFAFVTAESTLAVIGPTHVVEQEVPLGRYRAKNVGYHASTDRIFLQATLPYPPWDRVVLVLSQEWQSAPEPIDPGMACVPTPFRASTTISYGERTGASARLAVHDPGGRRVRTLEVGRDGTAAWNGRDDRGQRVPGGLYYIRTLGREPSPVGRVLYLR